MDEKLGKHGAFVPTKCAVSGQAVSGRPQMQIDLGAGYYCAVLAKHYSKITPELLDEIRALIPADDSEPSAERKPKRG